VSAPARHDVVSLVDPLSETHRAIRCVACMVEGGTARFSSTNDAIDLRRETVTVIITAKI